MILDLTGLQISQIRGDAIRLQQIFINLINNAIKFTHQGEIVITAHLEPQGESLLFTGSVRDQGIGIAPEQIKTLFTEFAQVDAGMTREYGGTELGLTISKKLCELMGGTVRVESEILRGSCFTFTALVHPSDQPPPLWQLPPQTKVLLIDGHPSHQRVLQAQLTQWNGARQW
ncbi:MAG: ATP-binding protein [Synechococcus sp.]|nr:ATP-binding protein [Synechococcus sp.]